jgi:hypothetical protein
MTELDVSGVKIETSGMDAIFEKTVIQSSIKLSEK